MSKKNKKIIYSGLMMAICFLMMCQIVLAQPETGAQKANIGLDATAQAGGVKTNTTDLPTIIGKVVGAGLALIGVVFFLLIIYGGMTWMLAMGKEEKITEAKDMIFAAVIGLIIVLGAYAVTSLVANIFTKVEALPPVSSPQ
jgi:hypothetical protein